MMCFLQSTRVTRDSSIPSNFNDVAAVVYPGGSLLLSTVFSTLTTALMNVFFQRKLVEWLLFFYSLEAVRDEKIK